MGKTMDLQKSYNRQKILMCSGRRGAYLCMWSCDSGLWGESSFYPHSHLGKSSSSLWPGWSMMHHFDMGLESNNQCPAEAKKTGRRGKRSVVNMMVDILSATLNRAKTRSILPAGCARKQHMHFVKRGQGWDLGGVFPVWASAWRNVYHCSQEQLQQSTPFKKK